MIRILTAVRPVPRGKLKSQVEFGAKLGVSLDDGFARIDTLSWDAYHEAAERNHIEGKFGQGKNGYNLNQIRARLMDTSESWIACIFFVMNLIHYENKHFFDSILNWLDRVLMDLSRIAEKNLHLREPGYVKIILIC